MIRHLQLFGTVAGMALLASQPANADTSDMRIAFSNNFAGNTFRQAMIRSFEEVAAQAVADGVIAEARVFNTSENSATEQAQQIQNLVLQGYNAIVLNASSATALNDVIQTACDQGVVVVSFDNTVTADCAWKVGVDFNAMGQLEVDYIAGRLDGGNVLEIRGAAGDPADTAIHSGIADGLARHTNFEVVGTVFGQWTQTVSQREVAGILPGLPQVDAVVTQGGDGFGAAQAFEAAGRDVPIIIMGNRYDELKYWADAKAASGYETMSVSIAPGVSTLAFWVAQQALGGNDLPKDITVPFLTVAQDEVEEVLASTEPGAVANILYTVEDAQAFGQ